MIDEKKLIEDIKRNKLLAREAATCRCIEYINNQPQVQQWIPCSERLPEELVPVNITWINRNPESYYAEIKNVPFTATGVYFDGKWYWHSCTCIDMLKEYGRSDFDIVDVNIYISAWQPLPKPYNNK